VFAHPGKTDFRGGHQCLKGCREWGLFHKEYHLHDKDWKPIRISANKKAPRAPAPDLISAPPATSLTETPITSQVTKTVTEYRYILTPSEANTLFVNPLLWALIVLLLLLLILRRKAGAEK